MWIFILQQHICKLFPHRGCKAPTTPRSHRSSGPLPLFCASLHSCMVTTTTKPLSPAVATTSRVVCRHYTPGPTSEPRTVLITPLSYQSTLLHQYHDHPTADHLVADKTAAKITQVGYWVGMLHDITENCSVCQAVRPETSKLGATTRY